jgi:hypothetical protein
LVAISNRVARSISHLSALPVDPNFRRCLVCQKWGRYESECMLETEERLQLQHSADEINDGKQVVNHLDKSTRAATLSLKLATASSNAQPTRDQTTTLNLFLRDMWPCQRLRSTVP